MAEESDADATTDGPLTAAERPHRLEMIDLLRGAVIMLMVLDHTRDFFHRDSFLFDPLDLEKTTPILFFTRWITHLCAPTFTFLAGVSICLQKAKGKAGWALSRFLFTRGLWLVVLELTVVSFGFNFGYPFFFLQIIFAIGIGMMVMSILHFLPGHSVLILGIAIIAGHDLLAGVDVKGLPPGGQLFWHLTMQPGGLGALPGFIVYPVIPWLGILCLGYGLGPIFSLEELARRRAVTLLAAGMVTLFLILRLPNLYGDSNLWEWQKSPVLMALDILDLSKYPPSLDYTLITLGVAMCLMLALTHLPKILQAPFLAFGRTPLLTYLIHVYLVHGGALLLGLAMGVPAAGFADFLSNPGRLAPAGWGLSLPEVYGVWLVILIALYPISRAFAAYRAKHRRWWTSYL
ncbi:DUF1624 domain-containing protein [Asticcacaulis sp. 201]|uniref:DUF1624 domain-containing protein n=1 Tax=Asticcacaulis sp. 201 TaxID=3028787 RepID=UPI002916BC85|nr:heparan-alpha-glucosaminide N-acetyltransferase domain-containing protein [Asticcacaulis sp. 201]MDV6331365.1 heparan-alpha-glucosaminide N-acetyltransferase domain-containing protein [Asticcacaulis sp. 201]